MSVLPGQQLDPAVVRKTVYGILAQKLHVSPDSIDGKTELQKVFSIDSFGLFEVMYDLEDAVGVNVSESAIWELRTVDDVVACMVAQSQVQKSKRSSA